MNGAVYVITIGSVTALCAALIGGILPLNPQSYAIKKELSGSHIEKHIEEVKELSDYQMIWTEEDGFILKPLEPGRLMTKYYLKFDTINILDTIKEE
ncbi:DExH-box ATP-dependent RNA helicase DExH17 [Lactuca sativa]|uniref:DExH-box ATP-dependent RNA helicase DExH17 n=1 Tax=Lactuca sativa TaxID=4236 RepID=UPI001C69189D|nr:DExH-box ATP-dependent RNA helicase DExH17 [Lactuca sativa]